MTKKIYVDRRVRDERPDKRVRTRIFKDGKEIFDRDAFDSDMHNFKHPRPPKPPRPKRPEEKHKFIINDFDVLKKTRMFTSKEDLVKFVNEIGDEGHGIDVYKIEDGLYKVVIVERVKKEKEVFKTKDFDIEVEDEIDDEEIDDEEIEIEIEEK